MAKAKTETEPTTRKKPERSIESKQASAFAAAKRKVRDLEGQLSKSQRRTTELAAKLNEALAARDAAKAALLGEGDVAN